MMIQFRAIGIALALSIIAATPAWSVGLAEKAAMQAAMQRHVDELTVGGGYLHLDSKTGDVVKLYPVTAHPTIMQMGENYVLCFDFKDSAGKDVAVDFYMAPKDRGYVVFHAAISNRHILQDLMKAGKVTRAD